MATAKLFKNGSSQAVRLPKEFRLPGDEVLVRRDGDRVILEPLKRDWAGFFSALAGFSDGFMIEGRDQPQPQKREAMG